MGCTGARDGLRSGSQIPNRVASMGNSGVNVDNMIRSSAIRLSKLRGIILLDRSPHLSAMLLRICSCPGVEVSRRSSLDLDVSPIRVEETASIPCTRDWSSRVSIVLPSSPVDLEDLLENMPATAPKIFKLRPACRISLREIFNDMIKEQNLH